MHIHTTQKWKGTDTYIYKDCCSILTHPALWCNFYVLMEEKATLTTLDYKSSYVHLLDVETCRDALLYQYILWSVLMALV